jgi:hypothetical protein
LLADAHAGAPRRFGARADSRVIGPEIEASAAAGRDLLKQLAGAAHRSSSDALGDRLQLSVAGLPSVAGERACAICPLGALVDALATL